MVSTQARNCWRRWGSSNADEADGAPEVTPEGLRAWAESLRDRFREQFWVTTKEGHYPAVALDGRGRAVDTLTSNVGHLIGTGILSEEEEKAVAVLLVGPTMSSGFGIRTLSTGARGYWPLSYHVGSVWPHDTAVTARGMQKVGWTRRRLGSRGSW